MASTNAWGTGWRLGFNMIQRIRRHGPVEVQNWKVVEKTKDLMERCREEEDCGCCGHSIHYTLDDLDEHHRLCDKSYSFGPLLASGKASDPQRIYKARGWEGENNMGKLTMQLAKFMTQECGWTLQQLAS